MRTLRPPNATRNNNHTPGPDRFKLPVIPGLTRNPGIEPLASYSNAASRFLPATSCHALCPTPSLPLLDSGSSPEYLCWESRV